MTIRLRRLHNVDQLRALLDDDPPADRDIRTRADAYRFVEQTVRQFDYVRLGRSDKGVLRRFLGRATGLSRAQITRLLNQHRATGRLTDRRQVPRRPFPRRYADADIELLAEIDALHGSLSGPTARKLCARACHLFGDRRFERLAGISNGHLYNLRRSAVYRRFRGALPGRTCPVPPTPRDGREAGLFGLPGHLRVVAAPRGDLLGLGGLCVNLVDEVTHFQLVASVERLDAACLAPVLEALPRTLPFAPRDFHAGNGGDRVDRDVAALLRALQAVGRPGSGADLGSGNDGRCFPDRREQVDAFTRQVLSPYLNYHRLRCFPTERVDPTGRLRKHCGDADIMTPYERLKSLPGAADCLTPGTTLARLDAVAAAMSDNEAARAVNEAHARLMGPDTRPWRLSA